ncbi:MAG: hypothetical protein A2506_11200 [Elusimicrobia bacterium RIFOXYD12_FULL_66_9]|nr:MAG: hypothetical protein A2506_11200 [Elusimicrobia bacterium RIFOXYD12_FULL_66_9]
MTAVILAALTAVLAAAVAADGLLPALRPGIFPLLMLLLSALAAAGAGRRLVGLLSDDLDEGEKTVAGATLGLGCLSLGVFALGTVGLLKPWACSALLGAFWLLAWPEVGPLLDSISSGLRRAGERPWLCVLIGLPLLAALWACLVPPHQYDSLVYHLKLPQEYLRVGRLHAPEGLVYAHFPQNGEMLFTLSLLLGSDVLAQMFVWLSTALTVCWLLTFGRRLTSAAPWAAVLVATHSAVLLMSSTAYVEPLVMLWCTAALLAFEASDAGTKRGLLYLSAAFTGLALGTKYYAGLTAVLLLARLVYRDRLREGAVFTLIVSAVFAPWLIKNAILVGNPVFPFLYKVFPATSLGWTSDLAAGYFQVLSEYGHAHGWLRDLASLPILLLRNPLRFGGGMDVLGDVGWDLTLWLWPLGLWAAWKGKAPKGLAVFSVLYFAGWFSTGVVLRFLTAMAPALALLGVAGAADILEGAASSWRGLAAAAAGTMVAAHLFLVLFVHGVFGSGAFLLALEDRETFLAKRLEYYPCAAYLGRAPAAGKTLVVGEQRGYYIFAPHRTSTVHAPNPYLLRADEAASPRALVDALRSDGYSRLLFVPRETRRLADGLGTLTELGQANWMGMESLLKTEFQGPACVVASLGEAR